MRRLLERREIRRGETIYNILKSNKPAELRMITALRALRREKILRSMIIWVERGVERGEALGAKV